MSNTYSKYCPNVFLACCDEPHERGDLIEVTNRRGEDRTHIIHNLIFQCDGKYYYSITREDGEDSQTIAQRKADRRTEWASSATRKRDAYWATSNQHRSFLALGEPVKKGHHSENRHRKIIRNTHRNMDKSMEYQEKAKHHMDKAISAERKAEMVDLSMPESIEYFRHQAEKAKEKHLQLKNDPSQRLHDYSLTYAKKEANEMQKKYDLALKLWGQQNDLL